MNTHQNTGWPEVATIQAQTALSPPRSGMDCYRLWFRSPDGDERDCPLTLYTGACAELAIAEYEALSYVFLRLERKPNADGSERDGEWPWEEVPLP